VKTQRRSNPPPPSPAASASPVFEPLDFVLCRAPLLPVEFYRRLSGLHSQSISASEKGSLLPSDQVVRCALAVGSQSLFEGLERASAEDRKAAHQTDKLLRYLIRMSTRPTPFGLFAGVALGRWDSKTTLALDSHKPRTRTRPDMTWLYNLISVAESRPEVRKHLQFTANSSAWIHDGRVVLSERAATGRDAHRAAVSLRATGVVRRALALARSPISYEALFNQLLEATPDAAPDKVARLIDELWQHTLIVSSLRPPLTTPNPARHVAQQLTGIPSADDVFRALERLLDAAAHWDTLTPDMGEGPFLAMVADANQQMPRHGGPSPVQTDMALPLAGDRISADVGIEAARAAELLLRLSSWPQGMPYLAPYRQAFLSRYGADHAVPLLELLDPTLGLGLPFAFTGSVGGTLADKAGKRAQTLLDLAFDALRGKRRTIQLHESVLRRLETWSPETQVSPVSLDLYAFLAAASPEAVDRGEFKLVVGPNVGASGAGRNLGRFADLLGPEALSALQRAAAAEQAHAPESIWAELVYQPGESHAANVVIRPCVRSHEIVVGVSPGVEPAKMIPVDELVVGVRNGRFYVHWPTAAADVVACTGHMLNNLRAPAVYRFLAEISHDGAPSLNGFDWGPASSFPFLPRVEAGRIVLRPAEWRVPPDAHDWREAALQAWRAHWDVPRFVYLSAGDNRLLLDLEASTHLDLLRREIAHARQGGGAVLQEAIPGTEDAWLRGPDGHYLTELVVSLVRKPGVTFALPAMPDRASPVAVQPQPQRAAVFAASDRLRSPGSDWLFLKLYAPRQIEDTLLATRVRPFVEAAKTKGVADEAFFVRYIDPEPHLRLRFHGQPDRLLGDLVPTVCRWAAGLASEQLCLHFGFDTYDRELDRYGGVESTQACESIFAADSETVLSLLGLLENRIIRVDRFTLALLSVDRFLAALGLDDAARLHWYRGQTEARKEASAEYRQRKTWLRVWLGDARYRFAQLGGDVLESELSLREAALAPLGARLSRLAQEGQLLRPLPSLLGSLVHMHLNRLMIEGAAIERRILGLLARTCEGLQQSPIVRRFNLEP